MVLPTFAVSTVGSVQLVCTLLLLLLCSPLHARREGYPVEGRITVPEGRVPLSKVRVILHANDGRELVAFVKQDGNFVLHDVPVGTHILDVDCMRLLYPQLRVDVSARRNGLVTVSYVDNNHMVLPDPLLIRPLAEARYFEPRQPFNLMAFVKSPMGLMMAFMVFAVVVLPMMKVDPEQYRELMEQAGTPGSAPVTPELLQQQARQQQVAGSVRQRKRE